MGKQAKYKTDLKITQVVVADVLLKINSRTNPFEHSNALMVPHHRTIAILFSIRVLYSTHESMY